MDDVNVGIIGLGNVGTGTVTILAENAQQSLSNSASDCA
jgi:hypothetical protein